MTRLLSASVVLVGLAIAACDSPDTDTPTAPPSTSTDVRSVGPNVQPITQKPDFDFTPNASGGPKVLGIPSGSAGPFLQDPGVPPMESTNQTAAGTFDDILWHHQVDGDVLVWPMDGTIRNPALGIATIGDLDWQIRGVGDYTGTGTADDILWRHQVDGDLIVWPMVGVTRNSGLIIGTVGNLNWQIQGVGDYQGSGTSDDILWRNQNDGRILAWPMDGTTRNPALEIGTVSDLDWQIRGVGDYTGTGTADDILWRHQGSGEIIVWPMDGATRNPGLKIATISDLNWQIRGVGDYTGTGTADDILWRHQGDGQILVWPMDGTTKNPALEVGTVGDLNWQIRSVTATEVNDLQAVDLDMRSTGVLTTENTDAVVEVQNPGGRVSSFDWRVLDTSDGSVLDNGTVDPAPAGFSTFAATGLGPFAQGPHRFAVELDPSDNVAESDETNNRAEAPLISRTSGFSIEIDFESGISQQAQDLVTADPDGEDGGASQVDRWTGMITGDLPDFDPGSSGLDLDACFSSSISTSFGTRTAVIEDLLILVIERTQDGTGGTLAFAGPCYVRSPEDAQGDLPRMTIVGRIVLDSDDVQNQSASLMEEVVAHEMGHVLGLLFGPFGGTSADFADRTGTGDGTCRWVGPSADEQYEGLGGTATWPPIEEDDCGHWEEAEFDDENMTPFASDPAPISVVSLGALGDRAYAVDLSAAEAYSLPSSSSIKAGGVSLGDHVRLAPLYEVDLETGVVRTLVTSDGRDLRPERQP